MRAYIAGAITNVPSDEFEDQKQFYEAVGNVCREMGYEVVIPHIHNGENQTAVKTPENVYKWASFQADEADLVVAEVSYPSLGTGGELERANATGSKIVLLSRADAKVSSYTRGIPSVELHIEYPSHEDACDQLRSFLESV